MGVLTLPIHPVEKALVISPILQARVMGRGRGCRAAVTLTLAASAAGRPRPAEAEPPRTEHGPFGGACDGKEFFDERHGRRWQHFELHIQRLRIAKEGRRRC